MTFGIYQNGGHYGDFADLNTAINLAEEFLGGLPAEDQSIFTVEDKSRTVLAAISNRRIIGNFNKQQWGGRKNDTAIDCGDETFDATDSVLLMSHDDVCNLTDYSEESDRVGQAHVAWDGPCSVRITDSILQYFGVNDSSDITQESFDYARSRANPQPPETKTVLLSVAVTVTVAKGADIASFFKNLNCSIQSETPGILIKNIEVDRAPSAA